MGWLSFVGGAASSLEAGIKEARAAQDRRALETHRIMTSEGIGLLRERREKTGTLKKRHEELRTMGFDSQAIAAILRLSNKRYDEFLQRADDGLRRYEEQLKKVGDGAVDPKKFNTQKRMEAMGITITPGETQEELSRDEIIKGIMGVFPSASSSKQEENSLKTNIDRHLGIADEKNLRNLAKEMAESTLGLEPGQLEILMQNKFETGDAPTNVKIRMVQSEVERLNIDKIRSEFEKTELERQKLSLKIKQDKLWDELIDTDFHMINPMDPKNPISFKKGSITWGQLKMRIDMHQNIANILDKLKGKGVSFSIGDVNQIDRNIQSALARNINFNPESDANIAFKIDPVKGSHELILAGSAKKQDTVAWVNLADLNLLTVATRAFNRADSGRSNIDMVESVKRNATDVINYSAVQTLVDEHGFNKVRDSIKKHETASTLLTRFYSEPVSAFVIAYFKKDENYRKEIDIKMDNLGLKTISRDTEGNESSLQDKARADGDTSTTADTDDQKETTITIPFQDRIVDLAKNSLGKKKDWQKGLKEITGDLPEITTTEERNELLRILTETEEKNLFKATFAINTINRYLEQLRNKSTLDLEPGQLEALMQNKNYANFEKLHGGEEAVSEMKDAAFGDFVNKLIDYFKTETFTHNDNINLIHDLSKQQKTDLSSVYMKPYMKAIPILLNRLSEKGPILDWWKSDNKKENNKVIDEVIGIGVSKKDLNTSEGRVLKPVLYKFLQGIVKRKRSRARN